MNSSRVLFISHDANRAGSQLLLLQLIRLLSSRGLKTHLLLCDGGELVAEFQEATTTTLLSSIPKTIIQATLEKLSKKVSFLRKYTNNAEKEYQAYLEKELLQKDIGLVFVNSIANSSFYKNNLQFLHHLPVVLFAHELELSVATYTNVLPLKFLLSKCAHLIAVSHAVANFYVKNYAYPSDKISTFTLINTDEIISKIIIVDTHYVEQNLNIPANALVIGGCGNAEWRKGNDIFNLIANTVFNKIPDIPVYFVWVGAGPKQPFYESIKFDMERLGNGNKIILIPPTSKALDIMTRFDIFLLSSREDPYPLVVLEAALLKKPIICFQNAGGAPELVESDAGIVVGYLDIMAASEAIVSLIQDPALRQQKGVNAFHKVLDRHNTNHSVQKVLTIIEENMR